MAEAAARLDRLRQIRDSTSGNARIRVEAEISQAQAALDRIRRLSNATSSEDVRIRVEAEVSTAEANLARLRRVRESTSGDARIRVDAEISSAEADLERVKRLRDSVTDGDARIRVDADIASAEADLRRLEQLRENSSATVRLRVDVDIAAAQARLATLEALRERIDSADVDIRADVDTGAAVGKLAALGAAVAAMDAGLSAGGLRVVAFGGALTVLGALVTPLLGALTTLGSLGAAAGAGLGLIAGPIAGLTAKFKAYEEGVKGAATAQKTADSSAQAYASALKGVDQANAGVATAERQRESALVTLSRATKDTARAQDEFNAALEDEPRNQAYSELDLADARDRLRDTTRDYNEAVSEYGANSEEASDALRAMQRAELDLGRQSDETSDIRVNGSEELRGASDKLTAAQDAEEQAARGVDDANQAVAAANARVAEATAAAAVAAQQMAADQAAASSKTVVLTQAQQALYDRFQAFKAAAGTFFAPAMDAAARLGVKILDLATLALPRLGQASTQTYAALTAAFEGFRSTITAPMQMQSINTILGITPAVIGSLSSAVGNLAAGLINMFATAAPAAAGLARWIQGISAGFLSWTQSSAGRAQILSWIQSAVPVFLALWNMVKNVSGALVSFGTANAPSIAQAINIISTALGAAIRGFGALVGAIGPFGVVIAALAPVFLGVALVVGQVASGLMTLVGIIKTVGLFFGLTSAAILPITLAFAALVAAGVLVYQNWDRIKVALAPLVPIFTQVWNAVKNLAGVFTGVLTGNVEKARAAFAGLPVGLRPFAAVLVEIAQKVRNFATSALGFLRTQGTNLLNWWRTAWPQLRAAVMPILTAVAGGIRTVLVTAFRFLLGQGRQFIAWFRTAWPQLRAAVMPVIQAVGQGIRTVLVAAFRFAISNARLVVNFFRQNWPLIRQTALVVFNAVKAHITSVLRFIGGIIRTVWGGAKAFWQQNSQQILAIARSVWSIIKTVISTAIKVVLGIIKATMQAITGDWRGAWQTIKSVLQTVWEALKTVVRAGINIVINILKIAWQTAKSLTLAAWEAVRSYVEDKIEAAKEGVRRRVNALVVLARQAWDALKGATLSAYEAVRSYIEDKIEAAKEGVRRRVDALVVVARQAWDALKEATSSAYQAVLDYISDKIERARAVVVDKANALKQGALDVWNALKDGTRDAFTAIGDFMWRPIESAYTKVKDWINKIIGLVNGILKKVGIDPIPLVGEGDAAVSAPRMMARGGVVRQGPTGGVADGPRTVYGEAGRESYVTLDRYTPESANALRVANQRWEEKGWSRPYRRKPDSYSLQGEKDTHKHVQHYAIGGLWPHVGVVADAVSSKFGVEQHSYEGHGSYGGYASAVDFPVSPWGVAANEEQRKLGNAVAGFLEGNWREASVNYLVWDALINNGNGWQDLGGGGRSTNGSPITADHLDHVHYDATDVPGGKLDMAKGGSDFQRGGGGGGSFNPLRIAFDAAWKVLQETVIDPFLKPLKGSENVLMQAVGGLAQKVPDGIKQWALKNPLLSGGSDTPMGLGGDPAKNRELGQKMNEAKGWGSQWSSLDAMWTKESGWDRHADNPTSDAYGIPQGMMGPGGHTPPAGYMPPESDAGVQIAWGLDYIANNPNFNDPNSAWAFHQANGYYAKGGMATRPHMGVVGEAGRELMLPLENRAVMQQARQTFGTYGIEERLTSLESSLRGELRSIDQHLDNIGLNRTSHQVIEKGQQRVTVETIGTRPGRDAVRSAQRETSERLDRMGVRR